VVSLSLSRGVQWPHVTADARRPNDGTTTADAVSGVDVVIGLRRQWQWNRRRHVTVSGIDGHGACQRRCYIGGARSTDGGGGVSRRQSRVSVRVTEWPRR
jgi:hypothetical protein